MRKILLVSLSVHWTVVFAVSALSAVPAGAGVGAGSLLPAVVLATGHGLAAALFLWTALAACGEGRCEEIAAPAVAAAALALAASVAVSGTVSVIGGVAAMQIAALAATWLVIRAETQHAPEPSAVDWSGEVARRLALGAAHGSMLSRLSQRGRPGGEG